MSRGTEELFLNDFVSNPKRNVFLIDESRPFKLNDQFAIFGLAVFSVEDLVNAQAQWYNLAIDPNYSEIIKTEIKGQNFYGSVDRSDLLPFRNFFETWVIKCKRLYFLFTSQEVIQLNAKTSLGKVRGNLDGGYIMKAGEELQPILLFIKGAANDMSIGTDKVEVIIDEAEQNTIGKIKKGQVKVSDFQTFNTVYQGKLSKIHCPTEFRIIHTSDKSPNFQHGLLFPDVICYLANKYGLFNEGKAKVDKDLLHIREIAVSKIIEATQKWKHEHKTI